MATSHIDLSSLLEDMKYELYDIDSSEPDLMLLCARFSDQMRDLGQQPISLDDFENLTSTLDEEGLKRLTLLVETMLESETIEQHLMQMAPNPTQLLSSTLIQLAENKKLLPIELMQLSEIRLEEFGRGFLALLALPIAGESTEESNRRLKELDYEALLGEASRAEQEAEERLAELRRIQEEERTAFDRSKW